MMLLFYNVKMFYTNNLFLEKHASSFRWAIAFFPLGKCFLSAGQMFTTPRANIDSPPGKPKLPAGHNFSPRREGIIESYLD